MNKIVYLSALIAALFIANQEVRADNPPCKDAPTVKDIDGNVYKTVQIGDQCWMKENMRSTRAADGSSIPVGATISNTTAYRYAPNDNTANVSSYGYLYNYPAALKVCPKGWHLPSKDEFEELRTYCGQHYAMGGSSVRIGKALAAKTGWSSYNVSYTIGNNPSANNASGFSALPAGNYHGHFVNFGDGALFWIATPNGSDNAYLTLYYDDKLASLYNTGRNFGFSVRCLSDK